MFLVVNCPLLINKLKDDFKVTYLILWWLFVFDDDDEFGRKVSTQFLLLRPAHKKVSWWWNEWLCYLYRFIYFFFFTTTANRFKITHLCFHWHDFKIVILAMKLQMTSNCEREYTTYFVIFFGEYDRIWMGEWLIG